MEGDFFSHAGALAGGAAAAGVSVWGFMRRWARGAADSQALREVRAIEKKHAERMDGLEKRLQDAEQAGASVAGELKQMNNRLSDIWNFLTKK